MIRCLTVVVSSFATALAGLGYAAITHASPGDAEEPSCTYTLSTPQVVQVSSTSMVTATLKPFPCTGSINPNALTVCLSAQGVAAPTNCGFSAGPAPAQVFAPYKPGTTYVTRGSGCGSLYTTQGSICATVGPYETTL